MDIIAKENNVVPMGVIFMMVGIFIYFVDGTKGNTKSDVTLMDYLEKIKL